LVREGREKVCLLWVVWVGLVGREGEWERWVGVGGWG